MTPKKRDPFSGVGSYAERVTQPAPAQPDLRDRPKTYRLGDELVERINQAAAQYNVEKSSLVKTLLTYALDALANGDLDLSLPEKPRKLT